MFRIYKFDTFSGAGIAFAPVEISNDEAVELIEKHIVFNWEVIEGTVVLIGTGDIVGTKLDELNETHGIYYCGGDCC